MYCPECGAEAGDAKFCPECGTDLRGLATSPTCAACDADVPQGARFCPECGEPTGAPNSAPSSSGAAGPATPAAASGGARRTGTRGKSAGADQRRRRQPSRQPANGRLDGATPAARPAGRVSPLVAWGALAAVAVVAVLVVVFVLSDRGSGATPVADAGTQSLQPVAADTSGSYGELVQRANGLYDQGSAKYGAKQYEQGSEYYLAASKVYAAAWKKQHTDPAVGTDYATSLFYAGDIAAALRQVDQVLAQSPQFQTAWLNKGIYLAEKGRQADENGNSKAAKAAYSGARAAFQKAIGLDPASSPGQQAKQQLSALPQ